MKYIDGIARVHTRGGWRWKLLVKEEGRQRKGTFSTREAAEDARDLIRGRRVASALGLPPPAGATQKPTLGQVLDGYVLECEALNRSASHVRGIRQVKRYVEAWRGACYPAELRRADLVAFAGWMRKDGHGQGRAIKNALVILRTALGRAEMTVPPMPELNLPPRAPKAMEAEATGKMLALLPLGGVARTAVEIALRTGCRPAELYRIRLGDVDLKGKILTLRVHKGRKGYRQTLRPVPISEGLARVLGVYLVSLPPEVGPDDPLLGVVSARQEPGAERRVTGRYPLGPSTLRKVLVAAFTAAGVEVRTGVGWTRATVATLARKGGEDVASVQRQLGHQDERTTLAHYDESQLREKAEWERQRALVAVLDGALDGHLSVTLTPQITPDSETGDLVTH